MAANSDNLGALWVAKCTAVAMICLGLSSWFVSRRNEAGRKLAAVEKLFEMEEELSAKGMGREERLKKMSSRMVEINARVNSERFYASTAAARGALAFHAGVVVLIVNLVRDITPENFVEVLEVWGSVLESSRINGWALAIAAVYHLAFAVLLLATIAAKSFRRLATAVV